jgi:hypothetical protein
MRQSLTVLLLAVLLGSPLHVLHAQEADAAYFKSIEGLESIVLRSWMAPMLGVASTQDEGTPTTEVGLGSPSGTALLSIFVYQFDSPENAAEGWQMLDADLQKIMRQDANAPMTEDIPLDGMGEQAKGYLGEITSGDVPLITTFATVQDGEYVYSLMGQFIDVNGAEETREIVRALIDAPAGTAEESYNLGGTSSGGLWEKLSGVGPVLLDNSVITDLIIYPTTKSAPSASAREETLEEPLTDIETVSELDNIQDAHGVTYRREGTSGAGVFLIDSWILSFDTPQEASDAVRPFANILSESINVMATSNSRSSTNNIVVTSSVQAGSIEDDLLPAGNATINIQQIGSTIYGVAAYAIDQDPGPTAEDVVQQMIDAPASSDEEVIHPDGPAQGGIWARFPSADDPLLGETIPVVSQELLP